MGLCTPVLYKPSCNSFERSLVEDPLEDSEILHSGEGENVEQWLEPRNKFFCIYDCLCLALYCFFTFHTYVVVPLNIIACISSITFIIGLYLSQQGGN